MCFFATSFRWKVHVHELYIFSPILEGTAGHRFTGNSTEPIPDFSGKFIIFLISHAQESDDD